VTASYRNLVSLCALAIAVVGARSASAQNQNPSNLWLVDLHWTGNRLSAGKPVKLTRDKGTNSQPAFSPDGRAIVFSAIRDTGANASSDIYRIDLATKKETRVTHTAENENSPTLNDRGEYMAVRWKFATLFKEYGVWVYDANGTPLRGVLPGPDTTGYYTPLPDGDFALTRPKSKTFTLALFSPKTGAITDVDSGLPALPAQRIPGERALSYVRIDSADGHNTIRRIDLATRQTTTIGSTVVGRTVHAWIPGHQTILMAKGPTLYARTLSDSTWRAVASFDDPGLRNVGAYVVSPRGDKLILTAPLRVTLAAVMRDSLDAGRSGADVVALVTAWRDAGKLAELDVAEGGIAALGDDRLKRNRIADAVAIHKLAATLFPKSYRAQDRLGDAQRAGGDTASAIASYRKALELNPRASDAERTAAVATEKKISGSPRP
jgi:dipeptidyl aminopeptidase/acylaminoacyl peptidase